MEVVHLASVAARGGTTNSEFGRTTCDGDGTAFFAAGVTMAGGAATAMASADGGDAPASAT